MKLTLKIFVTQLILVVAGLESQAESWPKLYFRKGATAYLPCIPQGDANAYFWKKGDTLDSSVDIASILHGIPDDSSKKGKYAIFENGTLAISSLTSEDEGRYFCRIVSESNECYGSLIVDLIVELEASFLTIEECSPRSSCTIFASLHSKLNLTCAAYSVPPLTSLRWFNGTKEISPGIPVSREENKDLTFKLSQVIQVTYGVPSSLSCKATDVQNHEKTVHVQLETEEDIQCKSPVIPVVISVVLAVICIVVVAISVMREILMRKGKKDLEIGLTESLKPLKEHINQTKDGEKKLIQDELSALKKKYEEQERDRLQTAEIKGERAKLQELNQELNTKYEGLKSDYEETKKAYKELRDIHSNLTKKYEEQERDRLQTAEIKGERGKLQELNQELNTKYEGLKSDSEETKKAYKELLDIHSNLTKKYEEQERDRLQTAEIKGERGKLQELNQELNTKYEGLKNDYEETKKAYKELLDIHSNLTKSEETAQRKYRSLVMKHLDNVALSCRISPRATTSKELIQGDRTLTYGKTSYKFDQLYSKETSQEAIFKSLGNYIQNAIDGENVFIVAVGGSGSGKTFTVYGEAGSKRNQGLAPRALERIFKQKEKLQKIGFSVNIKARYIHVCRGTGKGKEKYSLTSPTKPTLKFTEENHSLQNGSEISIKLFEISSVKDALTLLEGETSSRQVKEKTNQQSVENLHGIFQVTVETVDKTTTVSRGTLSFVIVRGFEALRESFKKPDKYSTNLSHYLAPFVQGDKCRGVLIAHITPDKFQESKMQLDELNQIKSETIQ